MHHNIRHLTPPNSVLTNDMITICRFTETWNNLLQI